MVSRARRPDLTGLDLAVQGHQAFQVLLELLREPREQRGQRLPQRGQRREVVTGIPLLGEAVGEPVEQGHLLGDGEVRVESQAGSLRELSGGAGVVQPARGDLDPRGVARAADRVGGQHDLVGQ
jgi:hypothetical protein